MNPQQADPGEVRQPAVAGAFYPADPEVLKRQVDLFLERAQRLDVGGEIVALVSPHAGYPYSGQIAGTAYKQIEGKKCDAVVVIAPSHAEYFSGVSVYEGGGYETPLGVVRVDETLVEAIVEGDEIIHSSQAGHRDEHSLEVQLPFLQEALVGVKIVPIVMADRSFSTCEKLAKAIARAARGRQILLVASSDLYHGYSYDECLATDARTLEAIEEFDPKKFCDGLATETYQACGGGPITVALLAAKELGADKARVIARTNSNDVTGERGGYCVGYAAVAIYESATGNRPEGERKTGVQVGLSDDQKRLLLEIARTTIEKKVKGEGVPEFNVTSEILRENRGAFVTIHKHGQLRGCIGYIEPIKPLYVTVQEMAESAALNDPRFSPVTESELKDLEIEISALTPLRKIDNIEDIQVGVHGIYIKKDYYSGLLLPQVATEYGWDRTTFLEHTCMKAGLPTDAWKEKEAEIYIFSADIFGEEKK